ncbi:MAG: 50S ribosomal protein L11 methyltransferase [Immundisolibacter sp.]|uniref:50S ribosomal protein L11 methyltransferase n=1 Tax=Immundisolibacter sp. TaxID=1934948 RepID=UPI003D1052B4
MDESVTSRWLSVEIALTADRHDATCALLEAAGALAVSSADAADRPVLEPPPGSTPLWPTLVVSALFEGDYDPAPLLGLLAAAGVAVLRCAPVADQDWARVGQDVPARHFGGALWVVPRDAPDPAPGAVVVRLDAGLGFGTGGHPTTALCLRWLAAHPPAGADVIDWGCGSGILAVAAARLGARHVWALDIDAQALTATRDNAARNAVAAGIEVLAADALPAAARADLVIANILAPVLVALAPRLLAALRPGGALLLSGLLQSQVAEVARAFEPAVRFDEPTIDQGWARLSGTRQ